ncbi:MAG TPA: serine hydrolase [Gemmatimonadaceae bacterium]|nr:serine hydrolase [Gemmatimonadaceae bacterium]
MVRIPAAPIRRALLSCAILSAPATLGAQTRDPLAGLDAYITAAMKEWKIPGVAVGIVKNDSVVFAKGFGVRTVGKPEPVDEHTLFAIASDTKAFTGMAIAMLVDDGRLKWDAPLTSYVPALKFGDDHLNRELTIRDALSHRSGLARGDLVWAGGAAYDRAELLRRLRFLKPSMPLRSRYGYSNLMYLAAGEAAAATTGKQWDDIVRERIFVPLGMTETNTSVTRLSSSANVATPHANVDGSVITVSYTNIDNAAAAGAINSNVADMTKWLRFQLDSGRVNGKRLVSKRNFIETHTPQTVMRLDSAYRAFNPFTHLRSYAFGWNVLDYRGREMLSHAGNLSGMNAMVGLLPEERVGIVVLTNMEGNALRESIMYKVFDMFLGAPDRDWSRIALAEKASLDSIEAREKRELEAKRVKGSRPSLPLDRYAGIYEDSLYGRAKVTMQKGKLVLEMAPKMTGDLEHWHYDTFKVVWRDRRDGTNMLTFSLDWDGNVEMLRTDIGGWPEEMPQMKRLPDAAVRTTSR